MNVKSNNKLFGMLVYGLLIIYDGWVISILWGWFVSSYFHLPPLSLAYAIGFMLIVTMFRSSFTSTREDLDIEKIMVEIFMPVFILVIGYLIHLFV